MKLLQYKEDVTQHMKRHPTRYPIIYLSVNGNIVRKTTVTFADLKKKQIAFKRLVDEIVEQYPSVVFSYEIYYNIKSRIDAKENKDKVFKPNETLESEISRINLKLNLVQK